MIDLQVIKQTSLPDSVNNNM